MHRPPSFRMHVRPKRAHRHAHRPRLHLRPYGAIRGLGVLLARVWDQKIDAGEDAQRVLAQKHDEALYWQTDLAQLRQLPAPLLAIHPTQSHTNISSASAHWTRAHEQVTSSICSEPTRISPFAQLSLVLCAASTLLFLDTYTLATKRTGDCSSSRQVVGAHAI